MRITPILPSLFCAALLLASPLHAQTSPPAPAGSAPPLPAAVPLPGAAAPSAASAASGPRVSDLTPGGDFPAPPVDRRSEYAASARTMTPLPQRITLFPGQAASYRVPGTLERVAVGNGELLDVTNIGRGEIVLIAKQPGTSSVHLWLGDGRQFNVPVQISSGDTSAVADTVRLLLADMPNVKVHTIGDRVVVTGRDVHPAVPTRLAELKSIYPQLLDFTSTDPVGMRPMVLMDVQIMEFNTNALEELGIKWDNVINGPAGTWIREVESNDYFRVLPEQSPFNQLDRDTLPGRLPGTLGHFGIATAITSQINLLMSQGKAVNLASPKLSARSGGNAKFLVGGEIPVPIPQGFGQYTIDYREYGIKLDIAPVVNSNGEISTTLLAEVSRIDPSVTVMGVPGLLTRRSESELNVRAGDTIVISGLVDSQAAKSVEKLPLLGDIPVLGRLFRSDNFRGNRTELVMFVTPRVITPDSVENRELIERGESFREQGQDAMTGRHRSFVQ